MNIAQQTGAQALQHYTKLFANAVLVLYSGTIPSQPEVAPTGSSLIAFTFAATPFGAESTSGGTLGVQTASFVSSSITAANSGTAGYGRVTIPTPAAWAASHAYVRGNVVSNNSNLYVADNAGTSAASGGPSGTTQGIVDGGVVWDYLGPSTMSTTICDLTVGTTAASDINMATTTVSAGATISINSFALQIPVV